MIEPWNNANLRPPPVLTSPRCDDSLDVQDFKNTFNNISNILSKQSPLHKESALLSRFVYKFDKKFRNDIGYRNVRKVNTALRKYLKLNLLKDIDNFISILPESIEDNYLPSRQMLEYIMVRLIAFSKIMLRVCICSKHAAIFYLDRVKRGESHWMSLMPYAVLCRIWTMSKVLLQHCCTWHSMLYKYLDKLDKKGLDFLPETYKLPMDLKIWLDLENLDSIGRYEWSKRMIPVYIDPVFVEDQDGDRFESIFEYLNQMNNEEDVEQAEKPPSENVNVPSYNNVKVILNKNVDMGEAVSRNNYGKLKEIPTPVPRIYHSADTVTNKETLHNFIIAEEKFRIQHSKQSLTSHLSFMQWQTLKNSLLNLVESLGKNRKIERKFQKIWKEKCLDYKCDDDQMMDD